MPAPPLNIGNHRSEELTRMIELIERPAPQGRAPASPHATRRPRHLADIAAIQRIWVRADDDHREANRASRLVPRVSRGLVVPMRRVGEAPGEARRRREE